MAHDLAWSKARLGCAAFAALVALPAAAQQMPTSANGLMTFPNVRVVQGAPVASASFAAEGLRAYRDPETGELGEPSAADVAALQSTLPSASRKPVGKALRPFRLARGGEAVMLDDSFMSYTVVRKAVDGQFVEACVVGDELAERLIRFGGPVALPARGGLQ